MEEWLQVAGQDVRLDKSCTRVQGDQGPLAVLLWRVAIPLAATFRQLGANITSGCSRITGRYMGRVPFAASATSQPITGRSEDQNACHAAGAPRCGRIIGDGSRLGLLETAFVRALWGVTCLSRAK